jgi:hypothetical protein
MKRVKAIPFASIFIAAAAIILLPALARAQLVLGQYEDEAPLRTWNLFGFQTASAIGRGDTSLALASDCSVALTNPALLLDLPGLTATLNGSHSSTSLFHFSLVNTGVIATERNVSVGLSALDFGGISYRFNGWAFATNASLLEIYDRPYIYVQYVYQSQAYQTLYFNQTGFLRNINLAVARKIGRTFQIGLGFNFVSGKLNREIEEESFADNITISQKIAQKFSGFYVNGGILARLAGKWELALVFRTRYTRKSPSTSEFRHTANALIGRTDIRIDAEATNTYRQPFVLGFGTCYEFASKWKMTADLCYFDWSSYKVTYFEEEQQRDFRDTLRAGLGAEYSHLLLLLKRNACLLLRLGTGLDQQPTRDPKSTYHYLNGGIGVRWNHVLLDAGISFGRENGSGHSLAAQRFALSISARI